MMPKDPVILLSYVNKPVCIRNRGVLHMQIVYAGRLF